MKEFCLIRQVEPGDILVWDGVHYSVEQIVLDSKTVQVLLNVGWRTYDKDLKVRVIKKSVST